MTPLLWIVGMSSLSLQAAKGLYLLLPGRGRSIDFFPRQGQIELIDDPALVMACSNRRLGRRSHARRSHGLLVVATVSSSLTSGRRSCTKWMQPP
jgi:hypothetical protein